MQHKDNILWINNLNTFFSHRENQDQMDLRVLKETLWVNIKDKPPETIHQSIVGILLVTLLSAVCVCHQGNLGDEGDIGEPGPPGLYVRPQGQTFCTSTITSSRSSELRRAVAMSCWSLSICFFFLISGSQWESRKAWTLRWSRKIT